MVVFPREFWESAIISNGKLALSRKPINNVMMFHLTLKYSKIVGAVLNLRIVLSFFSQLKHPTKNRTEWDT